MALNLFTTMVFYAYTYDTILHSMVVVLSSNFLIKSKYVMKSYNYCLIQFPIKFNHIVLYFTIICTSPPHFLEMYIFLYTIIVYIININHIIVRFTRLHRNDILDIFIIVEKSFSLNIVLCKILLVLGLRGFNDDDFLERKC